MTRPTPEPTRHRATAPDPHPGSGVVVVHGVWEGRDMTGTGTDADLDLALSLVSSRLGWMDVLPEGHGSALPWSCADVVDAQDRGQDPTAPWREALAAT